MLKTNLLQERIVYKPFEYQEAADYWLKQQQAHWLHTEVPMMSDVNDWKQNLTETEKNIIGSILKGFAQTETVVNDYWSGLVTKWFRKPEVIMMATTFGAFETIHAEAYSLLNETLGLENFAEFMEDEATMAKIENLTTIRDSFNGEKDVHEIAKSLAIFSAFTEGVNLFSSFAVLLSFKMKNRVNTKLGDLGYNPIIGDVDMTAVSNMKWFDALSAGKQHTDFFANRVTNYAKGTKDWDAATLF
jgi:ribonucleoside-diphosphate reductase beta chain